MNKSIRLLLIVIFIMMAAGLSRIMGGSDYIFSLIAPNTLCAYPNPYRTYPYGAYHYRTYTNRYGNYQYRGYPYFGYPYSAPTPSTQLLLN
jgi:hypothetical protein